jgi:TetR/AcrR family transcriptional repressor of mexJK operon
MAIQATAYPRSRRGRPEGGSEAKRAAMVQAAQRLFLRDGFDRTSVDAIADEAAVSKRTIYNHFGDKESLFVSVIGDFFDSMIAAVVEMMQRHLADIPDDQVEQHVIEFGCEAAMLAARSSERVALIGLMMTEARRFPQLLAHEMRPQTITGAIAERLVKLDARGLLDIREPGEAAQHLFALTMGQMNNRALFRAVPLADDEIRRIAATGARAFLRAYRPAGSSLGSQD